MMVKLINEILDKMVKICKPQKKFITEALLVILGARGKINFRNMSRCRQFSEQTPPIAASRKNKQLSVTADVPAIFF